MSFEGQTFETRIVLDRKLFNLAKIFEQKIARLDGEVKDLVQRDFPEIIKAFGEFKQSLIIRLQEAWRAGRRSEMNKALAEVVEIFDVLAEVIASGLEGYEVSNIIDSESGELVSSHFKKFIKDETGNILKTFSVHFNFVPTKNSEARFKVSYFNHKLPPHEAEKSLHIDRDERLNGVYIDINASSLEKVLHGIQGKQDGYGHHFKSEVLEDFIETENFSRLVNEFKEIIIAQDRHESDEPVNLDMLQKLKEHFA